MKTPWLKFYPSDWRADPALRACSIAARGLWIEMLCVMHEAEGYLSVNGNPLGAKLLASLVGVSHRECEKLLCELTEFAVFSVTEEGVIYSRRIVRDLAKAAIDRDNGKGGGNPKLLGGVNPQPKGGDKAQKPDARIQKPENNPSSSLLTPKGDDDEFKFDFEDYQRQCEQITGRPLANDGCLRQIIGDGKDLETIVLPSIRTILKSAREAGRDAPVSWKFFLQSILNERAAKSLKPVQTTQLRFIEAGSAEYETLMRGPKGSFYRSIETKDKATGKAGIFLAREAAPSALSRMKGAA